MFTKISCISSPVARSAPALARPSEVQLSTRRQAEPGHGAQATGPCQASMAPARIIPGRWTEESTCRVMGVVEVPPFSAPLPLRRPADRPLARVTFGSVSIRAGRAIGTGRAARTISTSLPRRRAPRIDSGAQEQASETWLGIAARNWVDPVTPFGRQDCPIAAPSSATQPERRRIECTPQAAERVAEMTQIKCPRPNTEISRPHTPRRHIVDGQQSASSSRVASWHRPESSWRSTGEAGQPWRPASGSQSCVGASTSTDSRQTSMLPSGVPSGMALCATGGSG